MPVSYIDVPQTLSTATKKRLVRSVYDAIHEAYPIPDTRVLIRAWSTDDVGQDGEIGAEPMRPICALEVPPGLSLPAKRRLVGRIGAAIAEACGMKREDVHLPSGKVVATQWVLTFFREYPLDQVALDGVLAMENPMVLESLPAAG